MCVRGRWKWDTKWGWKGRKLNFKLINSQPESNDQKTEKREFHGHWFSHQNSYQIETLPSSSPHNIDRMSNMTFHPPRSDHDGWVALKPKPQILNKISQTERTLWVLESCWAKISRKWKCVDFFLLFFLLPSDICICRWILYFYFK